MKKVGFCDGEFVCDESELDRVLKKGNANDFRFVSVCVCVCVCVYVRVRLCMRF